VGSLTDVHRPGLAIVWEKGLELPVFDLPAGWPWCSPAERWTGHADDGGMRRGAGFCWWVAVPPGRARLRALPIRLAGLDRSRHGAAVCLRPPVAFLRFRLPPRRVDLDYFRGAAGARAGVAAAPRGRLAFLGSRPRAGTLYSKS